MVKATFGAGCFWHIEQEFKAVPGVLSTAVGYAGGTTTNPTYKQVCTGTTGHAEVVQVTYDPEIINYDELLIVFWSLHDPTLLNRQGPDVGTQYRSIILVEDYGQEHVARTSLKKEQAKHSKPIVTEIQPMGPFYRAEEYHQCYLEKKKTGG
ncbi:MAG: peptide-methionine (S)-S-oxide reductase MsrA [Chlamydiales bacterium]|nr:peptide-methionine (S)-S-oxide reductase MsrA [Chlamydiales bacterium]